MRCSYSTLPRCLLAIAIMIALTAAAAAEQPLRQSAADLIGRLQPSVVNILIIRHTKTTAPAGNIATQDTTAETTVQSSGFFVDPAGVILTNRHVVADATDIIVSFTTPRDCARRLWRQTQRTTSHSSRSTLEIRFPSSGLEIAIFCVRATRLSSSATRSALAAR